MSNDLLIKDVLSTIYPSTELFAKTIFPDRFTLPFSSGHRRIFEALEDPTKQKVVIAAPRGFGKTSVVNFAYPAKNILFRDKKFIVAVSCSNDQAMMQTENLKRELLSNPNVSKIFGSLKSDTFSKEMWITDSGTCVFPRGMGQQVRGILYGNSRPDLIIIDDVESKDSVMSEELRKKTKAWFFADVMNSINRSDSTWKVVYIGTVLHEDSLLVNLLQDKTWHGITLEICDDNYKSCWKDFMSDEAVAELADSYRQQGLLNVFFMEYRNKASGTEDSSFKQDYFKYFDESELAGKSLDTLVIVDPAKSTHPHNAYTAIVGVSVDTKNAKIYIRDVINERLHPEQATEKMLDMVAALGAKALAVEVTSLHEFVSYPIEDALMRRRMFGVQFIELKAKGRKERRVASLIPFYRRGIIYHNKSNCRVLEGQLLSFPNSKYWDAMDATAYVVEVLGASNKFFLPGASLNETRKDIEAEYTKVLKYKREPRVAQLGRCV